MAEFDFLHLQRFGRLTININRKKKVVRERFVYTSAIA